MLIRHLQTIVFLALTPLWVTPSGGLKVSTRSQTFAPAACKQAHMLQRSSRKSVMKDHTLVLRLESKHPARLI